ISKQPSQYFEVRSKFQDFLAMLDGAIELPLKPKYPDIGRVYVERERVKVKSKFNSLQTLIETIAVSETVGIPLVRGGVAGIEFNRTLKVVFGSQEIEIVMDKRPSE